MGHYEEHIERVNDSYKLLPDDITSTLDELCQKHFLYCDNVQDVMLLLMREMAWVSDTCGEIDKDVFLSMLYEVADELRRFGNDIQELLDR